MKGAQKFMGEWNTIDRIGYSEFPNEFSRKRHNYQKDSAHHQTNYLKTSDVDWTMPDTYATVVL